MTGRKRHNGEGSIFPYRNGFAAYVWVDKPDGKRGRKWIYGKTREEVNAARRERTLVVRSAARHGAVPATEHVPDQAFHCRGDRI